MKTVLLMFFLLSGLFAETDSNYYEKTGALALAEVRCNWRSLLADWDLVFLPGRPNYLGMTYGRHRRIDIWIRPGSRPSQVAAIIVHELAHRVDLDLLTNEQRTEWYRLRGIPTKTPWYPDPEKTDVLTGTGDFANCAAWTFQGPNISFKSQLGHPPTPTQQQTIRKWFAQTNTAGN